VNYRHDYHAGNFADVVKHAVMAMVIVHLARKRTPFRVIDTHAGAGLYALDRGPAEKTGEWRQGIGRLWGPLAAPIPDAVASVLAPYLAAIATENGGGHLRRYPGSPRIARALMRTQDRLVVNELHVEDGARLEALFAGDRQTKSLKLNGWAALKAVLPPKERRGMVLIDPPFEVPGEFARLLQALRAGIRRFRTGTYLLWYPIKAREPVTNFHEELKATGPPKLMIAELTVRRPGDPNRLNGAGLAILNPPYRLEDDLALVLPFLQHRLAQGEGASHRLAWLTPERERTDA
jgi:23S rRNA (adenine2030-N6)-methyltransferase